MRYTHLNTKSHFSIMNSLLTIDSIIKLSKQNEFEVASVCDVNSVFGLNELYFKCQKIGMKAMLGIELRFNDDSYILYAKNYEGLKNIFTLSSYVNAGELTFELFCQYSSNLLCILNRNSSMFKQFQNGQVDKELISRLQFCFSSIYFIDTFQDDVGIEFVKSYNLKPLFGYEVKYATRSDKKYFDLLCSIKTQNKYVRNNSGERTYFMNKEDVMEVVSKTMFANVEEIISHCNVVIPNKKLIPRYNEEIDSTAYLSSLCQKGLIKRLGSVEKTYLHRLKYELDVIIKMGFEDYFLIVYDYVKFAKKQGILVGVGRGSAAGSLVSYVLGITDIDPIKYNLLFERFLNPQRISWPDIDIDFEDGRRDEVVAYVNSKYGSEYVGAISTFSTFASKQVVRDVAKAFGKNSVDIKYLTENISSLSTLSDSYKSNIKFANLINSDVENERIYQYALKLEGLVRHTSIHAAGIIISSEPLSSVVGVLKDDRINLISASMDNLEKMGLIKMDFLGLRNLTIIKNILNNIKTNIDLSKIDLNDEKVLNVFAKGETQGIFQFESEGMRNLLMKLKPTAFLDLAAANALHRPGPMDNIDEFVLRKQGKVFDYIHEDLRGILEDTYGIIVYQEQIMQIASVIASFSYAEADILRSAMSKKNFDVLEGQKALFIKNGIANGYDEVLVSEIYDLILKFANYGFNKAHAVSYSYIGYSLAYLKCYYPMEFMVALLNNNLGNSVKVFDYLNECRLNGIKLRGVDVNLSGSDFMCVDDEIVFPFTLIKGISKRTSELIVEKRGVRPFGSLYDFVMRVSGNDIKSSAIESLVYTNSFSRVEKHTKSTQIKAINGIMDIVMYGDIVTEEFKFNEYPEFDSNTLVVAEREALGFNFSNHPTGSYVEHLKINSLNITHYLNQNVRMILYVESVKIIKTKSNQDMAFVKCSDMYGLVEGVLFPNVYKQHPVSKSDLIYVYAKVEFRNSKVQIIINNLKVRSEEYGSSSSD